MDESHVVEVHDSQDYGTAELDSSDRLSELSDSLILVILSLLPMNDVVRTTILSKRWRNLWITTPCIDFRLDTSRDFICGVLAQWKGAKILKFGMRFCFYDLEYNDLDSWLVFAMEKQVDELLLDWKCSMYCPPQRLYSCSSITKLSLRYNELKIEENVQWNQLKSLKIKGLFTALSEDAINKVLSGAPQLEELVLNLYEITKNLNIRSTSLKMLHIGKHNRDLSRTSVYAVLRIQAPSLVTLEISAYFNGNCLLDAPSLSNAILRFQTRNKEGIQFLSTEMFNQVFRSICHVENVTLSAWRTEYLAYLKKTNMVVPYSHAKFLKLYAAEAEEILQVLEMFPNLKMLRVKFDKDFDYTLYGEEIHAFMFHECNSSAPTTLPSPSLPQLKTIEITWSVHYPSIIPVIQILLENAHMLEKMVLRLGTHLTNPETFTLAEEKVLSMSRSSPTAQVIISKF